MKLLSKLTMGTSPLISTLAYVWKFVRLCFIRREVALFLVYIGVLGNWSHQPGSVIASLSDYDDQSKLPWHEIFDWSAIYGTQNKCSYMQDRCVNIENIQKTRISLFAVFDGHGGEYTVNRAVDTLIPDLCKKIVEASNFLRRWKYSQKTKKPSCHRTRVKNTSSGQPQTYNGEHYVTEEKTIDFGKMITDEVLAFDHKLLKTLERKVIDKSGSTALIAILHGAELTVAYVGDSRGVMCDSNGEDIKLSDDHRPDNVEEMERITEAGGVVTIEGKTARIDKGLPMSRSLGDWRYKKKKWIIADPGIKKFDLKKYRPPFFVLASDGLYFKLTNQDVVEIVKEHLDDSDYGAEEVALEAAASKSSRDNIIVIVVRLKKYELETNLDVQIKEK